MKAYAGIGSRETPDSVLSLMEAIGQHLSTRFILRSGGAIGADRAFQKGHEAGNPSSEPEIYLAEDCTTEALVLAKNYHPAWDRCSDYAKKLHGRNGMIVLGRHLMTPVEFVVCWTKNGGSAGGTGQALRMAKGLGIPVFNLFFEEVREGILAQVKGLS